MKVHHIGYLVKKLDRALGAFQGMGYAVVQDKVRDEHRKIDIVFLEKDGYRIELVSPYEVESVVGELIKRLGNSPYHICYETGDLNAEIDRLRDERYVLCGDIAPAPACGGERVAFMIHPYLGMIELLEIKA